ncbi:diphthamide biosynthesis protein 3 [Cladophialophora carrionii CBS 160.54]|uniref:Diphthamide biosynthesis protein 3 n=1 Tax=Cladophialophora carrionii CBS 160.54 TaxID=1279043 RepID=V9DHY2_9EURO|nr:diphthamide biosynthesis protein 3 [Cladophialophora carrionii CBS 160.54]ETI26465.1 diphthamide biosynthesis protein 3 [Cladophialophora carrionii CBS 160.54]
MPSVTQTAAASSLTIKAAAAAAPSSSSQPTAQQAEDQDIYDEIEIEDMTFDPQLQIYHYPCPCGDRFEISIQSLKDGETDIAVCPSCSLMIRVIYEPEDLEDLEDQEEEEDDEEEEDGEDEDGQDEEGSNELAEGQRQAQR